jgi:hypothetical protein
MSIPAENPALLDEKAKDQPHGPEATHLDKKMHEADNADFISASEKIPATELQKLLEKAKQWEKGGNLDQLRSAGLTLDQLKQNPLERHIRLSAMYLRRLPASDALTFVADFQGNDSAQFDLDLADLLPPNILKVDVYNAAGVPFVLQAVWGFKEGRPGYFDQHGNRLMIQTGYQIKVRETQVYEATKDQRLGGKTYSNALKEEVYNTDNSRKGKVADKIREQAAAEGKEIKTDRSFFDVVLTDLMKVIDPKVWENFQKELKIDFSGLDKFFSSLIASLGFDKISNPSASKPAESKSYNFQSRERQYTDKINRDWLLQNVGRNNEQVQRFMVNINFMGANLRVNKLIAPYLTEAEARIKARGIDFHCKQEQCSCQNWRPIRGGEVLSNHSWGVAVDLNSIDNPWQPNLKGNNHGGKMKNSIPPEVVEIMKDVGFRWGGEWDGPADPMHFEMAANPFTHRAVLQSSAAQAAAARYLN